ncbi:Hypothetical protein POVN_LOCUS168 [uncultured virus]|nr:Hypothetical protein POVN_LOCUS168 [uncultured virus]
MSRVHLYRTLGYLSLVYALALAVVLGAEGPTLDQTLHVENRTAHRLIIAAHIVHTLALILFGMTGLVYVEAAWQDPPGEEFYRWRRLLLLPAITVEAAAGTVQMMAIYTTCTALDLTSPCFRASPPLFLASAIHFFLLLGILLLVVVVVVTIMMYRCLRVCVDAHVRGGVRRMTVYIETQIEACLAWCQGQVQNNGAPGGPGMAA